MTDPKYNFTRVQAKNGIWTPWATVLCASCHGRKFDRGFGNVHVVEDADFELPRDQDGCEGLTHCEKCGDHIWVRWDVAMLRELQLEIGGYLMQTGGMCAALYVEDCGPWFVVVTGEDEPCVGLYKSEDDFYEGTYDEHRFFVWDMDATIAEVIAGCNKLFPLIRANSPELATFDPKRKEQK